MAPRVLWAGLGNMGRGMCKNLVEKGSLEPPLMLYNRSPKRATDLSSALPAGKTEVVESIADAVAKADVIFTCVADDEAVNGLFSTMLKQDVKGKLFIDSSTVHPDTSDALAKSLVEHGAEFVAVPVFGPPAAAEAGQLIAVFAGPSSSIERARPWFKGVMAREEIVLADQPCSKASTLKLIGNSFIFVMVEQLAEGHVLAEKSGLGTQAVHDFVTHLFGGPYAAYSNRMLSGDYYTREEPLMAVDLARKDARHAMSVANAAGTTLKALDLADSHLAAAKKLAGPKADLTAIYGAVRVEAGLEYKNGA